MKKRLTLYSRPDCGLCEQLLDELAGMLGGRADVEVIDISADPDLESEYFFRIPVLSAGEVELSTHPLDTERVERYLSG